MRFRRIPCLGGLLITAITLSALAVRAEEPPAKQTLAVFSLDGQITESPRGDDFLFATKSESFHSLLNRLRKVEQDDSVAGVVLLVSDLPLGGPQIEEMREVLDAIKAAGKDVVAHAESLSMSNYLLLSGASRLSLVPTADVWISGIYGESPYLRGLLDMIGVTPDFTACGDFKSASEMFMRNGPSPAAEENLDWLMDSIFETYLALIARGRDVSVDQAREWIDQGLFTAERALEAGIVDAVQYRQDFEAALRDTYGEDVRFEKKYGKAKKSEIDLSSPFGLLKFYTDLLSGPKKSRTQKEAVAIVYVEGPILPGESDPSGFPLTIGGIAYSTPIRKALDDAAEDDKVKAVVLRVDSPGGSALASEIILNATKRVAARKPLAVSMGNVAGSGGYYVACGANTIFADASTITGSIGVVGGKLATSGMWNKIGVTWKPTSRGANAGILSSGEVFSDTQRELIQNWMNEIYEVFKGHVVAMRGEKLKKEIEELAGGRVYTGQQALELGLVDQLGGLADAIAHVAQEAQLEDYEVRVLPAPKSFIELLMSDLQDGDQDPRRLSRAFHHLLPDQRSFLDTLLPQLQALEPRRLRSVLVGLTHLQLLQQERVLMAMPVIEIRDQP